MQMKFVNSEEHNNDVNIDCKHVQIKHLIAMLKLSSIIYHCLVSDNSKRKHFKD